MTEMDYYRAFGIEPEEGAKEQEIAEPAEEEETEAEEAEEGAKEQEIAEPAEEEHTQSKEERARFAEGRRQKEQKAQRAQKAAIDEALRAERERHEREILDVFKFAGLQDADGNQIETVEQMKAFMKTEGTARLTRELKSGDVNPETISSVIRQEVAEQIKNTSQKLEIADAESRIEREIAEIAKYDPNIHTVEDLKTMDRAEQFKNLVMNHGHNFIDAYRFTYADKIAEVAARAAAQRAADSARSKAHMQRTEASGQTESAVPEDVMRNYRAMNPKMSTDDIVKDYQKYLKQTGKK